MKMRITDQMILFQTTNDESSMDTSIDETTQELSQDQQKPKHKSDKCKPDEPNQKSDDDSDEGQNREAKSCARFVTSLLARFPSMPMSALTVRVRTARIPTPTAEKSERSKITM